ncbi:MAG TPA: hypothetical protein VMK65_04490 [Longimicrobiales bacterium]|nr:hypothetical protein [Longimicrobiales bacterium]
MRAIRRLVDTALPVLGTLIVLGGVLFVYDLMARVAVVVVGLLLVEVGVWKLANPLLPNERRFHALRDEVDRFIQLVRGLNQAALRRIAERSPESEQAFEEARAELHASVERISVYAGRTDDEVPSEARQPSEG